MKPREEAEDIASSVIGHLDTMYPEWRGAASKSIRTSLRGHVINTVGAALTACREEAIAAVDAWRDPYILKGSENGTSPEQVEYGEYVKRGIKAAIRKLGEGK